MAQSSKRLDIVLVHYEWPSMEECGGSGRVAKRLATGLRERGHTVTVVTDTERGHYLTFPWRRRADIRQTIRDVQPDVVFAGSTLPTSVGLGRICDNYDVPLVVKTMGSDVYNPERFTRIRPLLDRVNDRIFAQCDQIICQSEAMAGHIDPRHHDHLTIVPNGIDDDDWEWSPGRCHDPLRLLTVARLQPIKRVAAGLRAAEWLRHRGQAVEYRIVGDGPCGARLRREWGDADWVDFVGWDEQVQPHYHWADIFVLPSAHESFGLVVGEAIASGTPAVTTATGGQREILAPGHRDGEPVGALADGSPASLGRAIRDVTDRYSTLMVNTQEYIADEFPHADMVTGVERVCAGLQNETRAGSERTSAQPSPAPPQPMPDGSGQSRGAGPRK